MRKRLVAAFALIAIALAGCSGSTSGSPSVQPTSTASVRTSPTPPDSSAPDPSPSVPTTGPKVRPGEKPPVLTGIAKSHSDSGALAFVRYWIGTLDWGYATTDSTLAKQNYLPSCADCRRFMRNFDQPRSKNEHFRGGRVSITDQQLVVGGNAHAGTTAVDTSFEVQELQTIDSAGKVVSTAPAISKIVYRTWVRWRKASWSVAFEKQVES